MRTWAQIQAYRAQVREKLQSLLDGFSDDELYAARDVEIDGETLRYSRADLLAHLLLHECRHHGDVSTLFYQLGIEFAAIEYRFYLLERG